MSRLRLLLGACCALLILGLHAGPSRAAVHQVAIIEDDAQLQINLTGTLAKMRALGATEIRYTLHWNALAPAPASRREPPGFHAANPAAYPPGAWAFDDALVQRAQAMGMSIEFQLTGGAPRWAEGAGEPPGGPTGGWKVDPVRYGQFVTAALRRYSGHYTPPGSTKPLPRVSFWGLWNEPNYGQDLAPQATHDDAVEVSAALYRRMVKVAWGALRRTGHLRDTVLIGETAPHGHLHPIGDFGSVAPQRWIDVLYCLNPTTGAHLQGAAAAQRHCPATAAGIRRFRIDNPGLFDAAGFAVHPYAGGVPPDVSQPGSVVGAADLAALPMVEQELDRVLRAYGDPRRLPLYDTEYGVQVGGRVDYPQAATDINWAEYLSYRDPRIESYAQYLLSDPLNGSFETGLRDAYGKPHPSLDAYLMPLFLPVTSAPRPRRLQVWGGVRPAAFARFDTQRIQYTTLQFRADGTVRWLPLRVLRITNPRGYVNTFVRFARSGQVRLRWTDPSGTVFHSRVVHVTV